MKCPSELYLASSRRYNGLPELIYPFHDRELLVTGEDLWPFAEGEIRRDDHRSLLVAGGEEIEEQLSAGAIGRDEAELVDDQQLQPGETAL